MKGLGPYAGHMSYEPIGIIRSTHIEPEQTPIQPVYAQGCLGRAEVLPMIILTLGFIRWILWVMNFPQNYIKYLNPVSL